MAHHYASTTYVGASAQLDRACEWLNAIGINYSPTRVGKYRKLFASVARHQLSNTLERFHEDGQFEEWVNAVHEVAEINRIFDGLSEQDGIDLVQRLKKSLKGHHLHVFEDDDSSGRDFSFELSIAAKFVRRGFAVDFGDDADVAVDIGSVRFFVECKRLKSALQIEKRISDGLKQLVTRYENAPTPAMARGLLALSIGRIANEEFGLLVGQNAKALADAAFRHNAAFISAYKSHWQLGVDPRTLGAVVVLDTPGMVEEEKKLVTCHEMTMNNSVPIDSDDYQFLLHVAGQVFA